MCKGWKRKMVTTEVMDSFFKSFIANESIHGKYHSLASEQHKPLSKQEIQKIYERIYQLNNEYNQLYQFVDELDCMKGEITNPVICLKQRLIEDELELLQDVIDTISLNNKK